MRRDHGVPHGQRSERPQAHRVAFDEHIAERGVRVAEARAADRNERQHPRQRRSAALGHDERASHTEVLLQPA